MGNSVEELIEHTLKAEGGFTQSLADSGNYIVEDGKKILVGTNWGIAAPTLKAWLKRTPTMQEMKDLPIETAKAIYRKEYFTSPGMGKLPDSIQANVFDMGVNAGQSRSIKILQQMLEDKGYELGSINGKINQPTVDACAKAEKNGVNLRSLFSDYRIEFYKDLVERKPKNKVYLKGWINRANEFRNI
jgi:lysozyme family protein